MKLSIRYNFRNPPQWARPAAQLYNEILDQIEWADQAGFDRVALAEHHFLEDGFLPGLLTMAAAIAARTKRVTIGSEVMLLPLHNPVRVAEDAAIVDIISGGRFELSVAGGYRPEEYAGCGVSYAQRGQRMEECLQIVKGLWAEDEFSFDGQFYQLDKVRMTPKPVQRPGPKLILGGAVEAVAIRAARYADGFAPQKAVLWDIYYDELERLGRPVERTVVPASVPTFIHVTHDVERDWRTIRPYVVYETEQYAAWGMTHSTNMSGVQTDDESLKRLYAVWTPDEAREHFLARQAEYPGSTFLFTPLVPGMDPAMSRGSLELIAKEVMPALRAAARG